MILMVVGRDRGSSGNLVNIKNASGAEHVATVRADRISNTAREATMEDEEILKMLGDGIRAAQADAIVAKHVVRELLVDVARLQPSPERYTTELYDRVVICTVR